jgi:hypothetical protein
MFVMAGLVPAIHVFPRLAKSWMPGIKPGMTLERQSTPHSVSSLPGCSSFLRSRPTSVIVPVTVLNALETRSPSVGDFALRAAFRFLVAAFARVFATAGRVLRAADLDAFFRLAAAFLVLVDRFAIGSPHNFHALQSLSIGVAVIRRQGRKTESHRATSCAMQAQQQPGGR